MVSVPAERSLLANSARPGRSAAADSPCPSSLIRGWIADRYSPSTQRPMSSSMAGASSSAMSGATPNPIRPAARSGNEVASMSATACSPLPGVCHSRARSFQT